MKVTQRQLRRIIREEVLREIAPGPAVGPPENPAATANQLKTVGAVSGVPFGDTAIEAIETGDFKRAASAVMDALWIDDPWPEDITALQDMLREIGADVGWDKGADPERLAQVAAKWLTGYRDDVYTTEEQKLKHTRGYPSVQDR
jgi:hypothetical protein